MAKKETTSKTATKTAKPAAKASTKSKATAEKKTSRGGQSNSAFMQPVKIGAPLHPIVGSEPIPRTEVTKKLWDYIKKNNLQNPKEKRKIQADSNLEKVFGGKKEVDMFEMTKLVNQHLSK